MSSGAAWITALIRRAASGVLIFLAISRIAVNRRISGAIGCQVEFTRIHDGGDSSLSAVEGHFDTGQEELLASGAFSGINASLTPMSWVTSEWGITQLSITRGTLYVYVSRGLIRSVPHPHEPKSCIIPPPTSWR